MVRQKNGRWAFSSLPLPLPILPFSPSSFMFESRVHPQLLVLVFVFLNLLDTHNTRTRTQHTHTHTHTARTHNTHAHNTYTHTFPLTTPLHHCLPRSFVVENARTCVACFLRCRSYCCSFLCQLWIPWQPGPRVLGRRLHHWHYAIPY